MGPEKWEAFALENGLTGQQYEALRALLENDELWKRSESLVRFFEAAEAFGVSDYLKFAPSVIRGLAYYTGTVFEARDRDDEFRAILGGGRYDNLVGDVGGDPLPAVGFAMGDKVIEHVLAKFGRLPSAEDLRRPPVLVSVFDADSMDASIAFAGILRAGGVRAAFYPEAIRLGNQFRYADRIGARFVAILGPEERTAGRVTLKDLETGEQETLEVERAVGYLKGRMGDQAEG
jgi:histidyl-tRNA synthetase